MEKLKAHTGNTVIFVQLEKKTPARKHKKITVRLAYIEPG